MLYRYIVENYKSFKERAELALIPQGTDGVRAVDRDGDLAVLKTAVIFGANASGKSNLVKSMKFARNLILDNEKVNSFLNPCFRLDNESVNRPTMFNFEIKIDGVIYQYGFSVLFSKSLIQEEWLYDLVENKPLFARTYDSEKERYDYEFAQEGLTEEDKKRLSVYEEDMRRVKDRLLLTELAFKDFSSDAPLWGKLKAVFSWFKELNILFPSSKFNLLTAVAKDESKINEMYKDYFRMFGIPIDTIHLNDVPIGMLQLDPDLLSEIKNGLLSESSDKKNRCMINLRGHEYLLELDESGDLSAKEVRFQHCKKLDGGFVDFSKSDESDGTQRLFDLIPALARLAKHKGVWVIDEIDRSLHSLLTRHIISLFLKESKNVSSQLICTTHEQSLMDSALLGADEIWLVQKNAREEASELYSLANYNVRFPENIEKNYLLGRYKAIPLFGD